MPKNEQLGRVDLTAFTTPSVKLEPDPDPPVNVFEPTLMQACPEYNALL